MNSTPTGTMMLTTLPSAGMAINRISISKTGAMAIFQLREMYTTPRPPKRAGRIWSKAGARAGEFSTGVSGVMRSTPRTMISVVTMLETAMAMVETISPSSVLISSPTSSSALSAAGALRFVILPVTKAR